MVVRFKYGNVQNLGIIDCIIITNSQCLLSSVVLILKQLEATKSEDYGVTFIQDANVKVCVSAENIVSFPTCVYDFMHLKCIVQKYEFLHDLS